MTEPLNSDTPGPGETADEKKRAARALVIHIIRATGAFFMLAGAAVLGGAASGLMHDDFTEKVLGIAFCLLGLLDFFAVPLILAKAFLEADRRRS